MEVRHTVIFFFFFLSLQEENFGVISAEIYFIPFEGQFVEVKCSPSLASTRKFFCRGECRVRDIIIETTDVSAQDGRFSIEWKKRQQSSFGDVSVKVSQLTKSDSGRYRCGVGSSSASYTDIEIIVVDAKLTEDRREPVNATPGGSFTAECIFSLSSTRTLRSAFFCKDECLFLSIGSTDTTRQNGRYSIRYVSFNSGVSVFVSISQLTQSDSGRYKCGLTRNFLSDLEHTFEVFVPDDPTTVKRNFTLSTSVPSAATTPSNPLAETTKPTKQPGTATTGSHMLLYAGLTLVALVVLLSLVTFIFCRRRSSKPKETPVETEFTSVTETNRAYEDPREDKQRRSPPYEHAVYTKPNEVEINHEYSSVIRARSQYTAEDDSGNITYSELNFTNPTVVSDRSAPSGQSESVIYSSPREM